MAIETKKKWGSQQQSDRQTAPLPPSEPQQQALPGQHTQQAQQTQHAQQAQHTQQAQQERQPPAIHGKNNLPLAGSSHPEAESTDDTAEAMTQNAATSGRTALAAADAIADRAATMATAAMAATAATAATAVTAATAATDCGGKDIEEDGLPAAGFQNDDVAHRFQLAALRRAQKLFAAAQDSSSQHKSPTGSILNCYSQMLAERRLHSVNKYKIITRTSLCTQEATSQQNPPTGLIFICIQSQRLAVGHLQIGPFAN